MSFHKFLLISAVIFFGLFGLAKISWAKDYYVSSWGGGTWAQATNRSTPTSPLIANANVAAGDTVILVADGGELDDGFAGIIGGFNPADGCATAASGTAGNVITYRGETGNEVVVGSGAFILNSRCRSYVTYENFKVRSALTKSVPLSNSTNITFSNITFESTAAAWQTGYIYGWVENGDISDIIIRNCTIAGTGTGDHGDMIYFVSSAGHTIQNILIEGCTISGGAHNAVEFQPAGGTLQNIIIRNNTLSNPYHTVLNMMHGATNVLVENNIIKNGGSVCSQNVNNCCNSTPCTTDPDRSNWLNPNGSQEDVGRPREEHPAIQMGGWRNFIIRRNIIYNSGFGFMATDWSHITDAGRIYNNTVYDNVYGVHVNTDEEWDDVIWKNNIFSENDKAGSNTYHTGGARAIDIHATGNPSAQVWAYNLVYDTETNDYSTNAHGANDNKTVAWLEANIDDWIVGTNLTSDPLFVNRASGDFNLQSNSPAINAGSALTTVAAADTGSGVTLIVSDARYFQDGTFATPGQVGTDYIAVGTVTNIVQISSISYTTNTITLVSSINRNVGDKVWLYKNSSGQQVLYGSAPDIGAYEYVSVADTVPPNPPTGVSVI